MKINVEIGKEFCYLRSKITWKERSQKEIKTRVKINIIMFHTENILMGVCAKWV